MSARNTTDGVEGSWSAATASDGVPAAARGGLDATSRSIIEQLQQDGRRSYAAIGKAVGLSEAAVRQRVQRLTDSGVMQIVAVTDPMQVGFTRAAMIGIGVNGDLQAAADAVEAIPAVTYAIVTAGQYDLLAEVVCENDEHLLGVLSEIRRIADVTKTETFVYLKVRKQTYSWGTR
jgi:Lrp/AsnC family transcriptional regulator for asnA, asnC and gidA